MDLLHKKYENLRQSLAEMGS
ncbi:MAG: hypothetical protein PHD01_07235, partial [Geobacteraceae bacterium]|nr:hypothetical protein [Geobacteraceae bacterium]